MLTAALILSAVLAVGIIGIGSRFLVGPAGATRDFGVSPDSLRALTAIKGVRDIGSGVVVGAVWLAGSHQSLGATMLALALIPVGDATIVLSNGGTAKTAFGIHGLTALVMVLAGLVLVTS